MSTQEKNDQENKEKTKRHRSPNYPYYSLLTCVAFLNKFILNNRGFTEALIEYAVKYMGYSVSSSRSNRVISSMVGFGLLEYRGTDKEKYFWPSELAKKIYNSKEGSEEKIHALQEAALSDPAILSIWQEWQGKGKDLPNRDTLEKWLHSYRKFSDEGAKRFADVIEETYEFAHLKDRDKIVGNKGTKSELGDKPSEEVEMSNGNGSNGEERKNPPPGLKEYRIPIDDERDALFYAPMGMTESDYDSVTDFIDFLKKRKAKKG